MSNIIENLEKILSARYGEEVRQAIHDTILQCYEDGKAGSRKLEFVDLMRGDKFTGRNGVIINGAFVSQPNGQYVTTDFIEIVGQDIYVKGTFAFVYDGFYQIYAFDKNKSLISGIKFDTLEQDGVSTLPEGTRYIRVTTSTTLTDISIIQVVDKCLEVIGKTVDSAYELSRVVNSMTTLETIAKSNIIGGSGVISNYIYTITNMIAANTYINSIDLTSVSSTSIDEYLYYISVDGEVLGKWQLKTGITSIYVDYVTTKNGYFAYHNVAGKDSGVIRFSSQSSVTDTDNNTLVQLRLTSATEILEVGNTANLVANSQYVYFNMRIKGVRAIQNGNNRYQGKLISFLGDSITQGWYYYSDEDNGNVKKPYPMTVAEDLECRTQNAGYGGYALTYIEGRGCLSNIYQNVLSTEANHIVVFGGTNDYFLNAPIGTINDRDNSTFYGAVFTLINGITTNFPNAELTFCTPIHRNVESANANGYTLSEYVNAIKEMCALCGIKVIDLYSNSGFSYKVDALKAYYTDGLHLTQEGYTRLGHVMAHELTLI